MSEKILPLSCLLMFALGLRWSPDITRLTFILLVSHYAFRDREVFFFLLSQPSFGGQNASSSQPKKLRHIIGSQ